MREGQFLTLFGPNGAGKSTLLKIVATLVRPTSGHLEFRGKRVEEGEVAYRNNIGVVSHQSYFYDSLTAAENLAFYGRVYGLEGLKDKVMAALDEVGLTLFSNDLVRTFSRGMIQRLAIARALIHRPGLLLLDEPYTGLDQQATRTLSRVLERFKAEGGSTIMVSHSFSEGLAFADHVTILNRGRVAFEAPAAGLTPDLMAAEYTRVVGEGAKLWAI